MRGNVDLTPAQTHTAAQSLADKLGPMEFAQDYFSDLFNAHARRAGFAGHAVDASKKRLLDPSLADEVIKETDYLNPVQQKALQIIREGKSTAPRLSAALPVYLENHKNGKKKRFVQQATRDWDRLITAAGDVALAELAREHARLFLAHCKSFGMSTTSVRRCVNNVRAIFNFGIKELDIRDALKPFSDLPIPNEGTDKKKVKTPSPAELHEILEKFRNDTKDTGIIVLLQMGLGTRVAEISGLAVAEVVLDAETPHMVFVERDERTLKTDNSTRKTPLVGFSLDAAKLAVKKAGTKTALFSQYAKENGNANASSAVNARLEKWGIGTHGFRHAMTDLLRAAGCPADIRKEITGHAKGSIAENYGEGHMLKVKAEWMEKALALIQPANSSAPTPNVANDASSVTAN